MDEHRDDHLGLPVTHADPADAPAPGHTAVPAPAPPLRRSTRASRRASLDAQDLLAAARASVPVPRRRRRSGSAPAPRLRRTVALDGSSDGFVDEDNLTQGLATPPWDEQEHLHSFGGALAFHGRDFFPAASPASALGSTTMDIDDDDDRGFGNLDHTSVFNQDTGALEIDFNLQGRDTIMLDGATRGHARRGASSPTRDLSSPAPATATGASFAVAPSACATSTVAPRVMLTDLPTQWSDVFVTQKAFDDFMASCDTRQTQVAEPDAASSSTTAPALGIMMPLDGDDFDQGLQDYIDHVLGTGYLDMTGARTSDLALHTDDPGSSSGVLSPADPLGRSTVDTRVLEFDLHGRDTIMLDGATRASSPTRDATAPALGSMMPLANLHDDDDGLQDYLDGLATTQGLGDPPRNEQGLQHYLDHVFGSAPSNVELDLDIDMTLLQTGARTFGLPLHTADPGTSRGVLSPSPPLGRSTVDTRVLATASTHGLHQDAGTLLLRDAVTHGNSNNARRRASFQQAAPTHLTGQTTRDAVFATQHQLDTQTRGDRLPITHQQQQQQAIALPTIQPNSTFEERAAASARQYLITVNIVVMPDGNPVSLMVRPALPVDAIRQQIAMQLRLPEAYYFSHRGRRMQGHWFVFLYDVKDGDRIDIIPID